MRANYFFSIKIPAVLIAGILLFASCKKSKGDTTPPPPPGSNVTEIAEVATEGNVRSVNLLPTAGSETITAITLKNQGTGSSSIHVKLITDNAAVTAASLMNLPLNSYTLATLEYDIPAGGTTVVPLIINRGNLTVDTTYGIAFEISTVSSGTISSTAKKIVVKVSIRNRWDGRYRVTGTMTDFVEPTIYSFPDQEVKVITTGVTQVKVIPLAVAFESIIVKNIDNPTFYGSFGPVFNFDATTNKVTSVINFYGQPAPNTRSAEIDPSGTNQWDAVTKNMSVKFWMNQPSVISPHRATFNTTWTYLGPR